MRQAPWARHLDDENSLHRLHSKQLFQRATSLQRKRLFEYSKNKELKIDISRPYMFRENIWLSQRLIEPKAFINSHEKLSDIQRQPNVN